MKDTVVLIVFIAIFFALGLQIISLVLLGILAKLAWDDYNRKPLKLRGPLRELDDEAPALKPTDLTKWHLEVERGIQVWKYNEKQTKQTFQDKYFLGLDTEDEAPPLSTPSNISETCRNALLFYSKLQTEDGHWANDYGGPLFLLPGLVFTCYLSKTELPEPFKAEIIRYLTSQQRKDGGWGLHIESISTMFGTAMNYCALRIVGVPRNDPRMVNARKWMEERGGAVSVPHWGKFWLSAIGVYEWDGMNPVPPELWVLPYSLIFHPGRWWCHCRVVYLPMAWVYGSRHKYPAPVNELTKRLREELYIHEYDTIHWASHRNNVYKDDNYKGHSPLFHLAFKVLSIYELFPIQKLREYALKVTLDHIRYEDRETHYIDIGPVNKAIDMLCEYLDSQGKSDAFKQHQDRVYDYLWLAADGMKMQGYNGSQLWDTAFSLQAILSTGKMCEEYGTVKQAMIKGYDFIDITQVRENNTNKDDYYRHISKGAWPFSTVDHGWPISDCTAEGFKCALEMPLKLSYLKDKAISSDRLFDAVNVMLSYQNQDGGWPTYENQRGPAWLEMLNPAGCFDGIMVDYSYNECTSACMQALLNFAEHYPNHRNDEIKKAVARGAEYLINSQKPDGGWHGCWGVCYTYGAWFAINALTKCKALGLGPNPDNALKKGYQFLVQKQKEDGSWGEDFKSCSERRWVESKEGHVVNTSWALLALMTMEKAPIDIIEKGIAWISSKQLPNGDWKQGTVSGVFNYNCAISYSGYKNIFPIWALGVYLNKFDQKRVD